MPESEKGTIAPIVSIAMPVFNGGAALRVAVLSLRRQSFENWELLLIDDGSTDGAAQAAAQCGDVRIRLIEDGLNRGLGVRLNEAIGMARGRYLARMDHDDIAHPDRLREQVAMLDAHPEVDLVASRCVTISTSDELQGYLGGATDHAAICRRPWHAFPMPHPTWMGRIEWFRSYLYPVPAPYYSEDFELLLRSHAQSRFAVLPQPLLAYRLRNRIDWKKQRRARLAQFAVQRHYFLAHHQYGNLVLAGAVTLLRFAQDGVRMLRQTMTGSAFSKGPVSQEDAQYWRRLILDLQRETP